MRINGFYLLVALTGSLLVFISVRYFSTTVNGIPAVTAARALTVRTEYTAEVLEVRVRPGQTVQPGDTLVLLSSAQLVRELEKLDKKLESLQTEQSARRSAFQSSLNLVRTDISLKVRELEQELHQAEKELDLNTKLLAREDLKVSESSLAIEIRDMKAQIALYRQREQERESELRAAYTADQSILQSQLDLTNLELQTFQRARRALVKVADHHGVVETVSVRQGSVVDAFTGMVTLLPANPVMVVAFMQYQGNDLLVGDKVEVAGMENPEFVIQGKVTGFGSMVALPEILQKSTAVKAYGREIFIEIPDRNPFTTGQKVLVKRVLHD